MRMIALTGTNGKTTTTHVISHILHHVGYKTGVIGTVHALIGDKEIPTHNTTPDVIDLQRILYQMLKENVTHVCMEVSSHSLVMGRVIGCEFDTAVFTNLTEDHWIIIRLWIIMPRQNPSFSKWFLTKIRLKMGNRRGLTVMIHMQT